MSQLYGATNVFILADDLTGAADAAVAFVQRAGRAKVLLDCPESVQASDVIAFCTASRDISPDKAAEAVEKLAGMVSHAPFVEIFKKVDSVFRGNTLTEIQAVLGAFPGRFGVIAPAFPAVGRTCRDGFLTISDLSGQRTVPLRDRFRSASLDPAWVSATTDVQVLRKAMYDAYTRGASVFCDAVTDQHLRAIVEAAWSLDKPVLWIGSGGLAHALAETRYRTQKLAPPKLESGALAVFTGSNHPVSRQQLKELRSDFEVWSWPEDDRNRNDESIFLLRVESRLHTDAEIQGAYGLLPSLSIGSVLLNGGDTALKVCRALGVHTLELLGEFEPGIPMAVAIGGRLDGRTIVLKSGGFGDSGLLSRVARDCAVRKEATA